MPFDAMPQGPAVPPARLLYVLPAWPEEDHLVAAEVEGLRHLGIAVVTVSVTDPSPGLDPAQVAGAGVGAGRSPAASFSRKVLGFGSALRLAMVQRDMSAGRALRLGAGIAEAFRRHGCGHIHVAAADAAATAALVGAHLAHTTLSMTVRDEDEASAAGLAFKRRAANLSLAAGPGMVARLRALVPQARLHVLPCAIDADSLAGGMQPDGAGPAYPALRNGRILCLPGGGDSSGLRSLLTALAGLPPERRPVLDIIGALPLLDTLRAEAVRQGVSDQLRFLGARDDRWLAVEGPRYLGLVAPGAAQSAAWRPALRGMALGLPVLATAAPGMQDIVQPDAGHIVPAGDAVALARALRWLMIMPEDQRRWLGRAGRDRVLAGHTMAIRAAALARALRAQFAPPTLP